MCRPAGPGPYLQHSKKTLQKRIALRVSTRRPWWLLPCPVMHASYWSGSGRMRSRDRWNGSAFPYSLLAGPSVRLNWQKACHRRAEAGSARVGTGTSSLPCDQVCAGSRSVCRCGQAPTRLRGSTWSPCFESVILARETSGVLNADPACLYFHHRHERQIAPGCTESALPSDCFSLPRASDMVDVRMGHDNLFHRKTGVRSSSLQDALEFRPHRGQRRLPHATRHRRQEWSSCTAAARRQGLLGSSVYPNRSETSKNAPLGTRVQSPN